MSTDYIEFIAKLRQGNPSPGGLLLLRQCLSSVAPIRTEGKILEIGSNTGASLAAIAEYYPKQEVIGIDNADSMVEECKKYIESLMSEGRIGQNVSVEKANAESLPYPNESFDLVVSGGTLSFVNDRAKAVQEVERVLKSGGTFLSIEYGYYDVLPPKSISDALSDVLGFNVAELTHNYWHSLHSMGSLELEGVDVREAFVHRTKDISKAVKAVEDHLKRKKVETSKEDLKRLSSYLSLFQKGEKYNKIFVFSSRKHEGTEILMDVAN